MLLAKGDCGHQQVGEGKPQMEKWPYFELQNKNIWHASAFSLPTQ